MYEELPSAVVAEGGAVGSEVAKTPVSELFDKLESAPAEDANEVGDGAVVGDGAAKRVGVGAGGAGTEEDEEDEGGGGMDAEDKLGVGGGGFGIAVVPVAMEEFTTLIEEIEPDALGDAEPEAGETSFSAPCIAPFDRAVVPLEPSTAVVAIVVDSRADSW